MRDFLNRFHPEYIWVTVMFLIFVTCGAFLLTVLTVRSCIVTQGCTSACGNAAPETVVECIKHCDVGITGIKNK